MKVNEYNAGVLERLVAAIDEFSAGSIDLDDIQARLQSSMSILENDGSGVVDLVRLAEADIERIQFTMLRGDQRPAALFRLDELRQTILEEEGSG